MTTQVQPELIRQQLEAKLLDHYLEIDSNGDFVNPPKTDDELDEFVRLFFHVKLPRKRIEPGHRPPFEFLADLYFERVKNALGFASRNGGKTYAVAILNFLDMLFKKNCEVASAGAVLTQASKCYSYFCGFLELPRFKKFCEAYTKKTGRSFIVKNIQSWTELGNGSTQEILTGTDRGLRSPHPNKARLDEIDLVSWAVLQTGLSMAKSTKASFGQPAIRGQNVFTSTRQQQQGTMQRLLDEAHAKGIEVYEWNIWETLEKCTRRCVDDKEHGNCPIYTFCKGKAHHCDGFYTIDDFIDKVRVLDRETWEVEWLNKRPSRHKLVYNMMDSTRHIMTPQRLYRMTGFTGPQMHWRRLGGLDFGSSPGHPFVYLKACQLPKGEWLIFHEYVAEQRLLRDHAKAINESPFYTPGEHIFSDHDAQDRLELRALGIRTKPAEKDVAMGIDYVKSLLQGFPPSEEPQLYIWHSLKFCLEEFGMYQWPQKPDGQIDRTGLPMKKWDNCMDAMRYLLYSSRTMYTTRYRSYSIPGI